MKSRSVRMPSAVLAVIMAVFMMFSSLSLKASALDTSVREGVCAVVFFLKDANFSYYNSSTKQFIAFKSLGDVQLSSGSGFFVGKQGENPQYIVTNEHVIDKYIQADEGGLFYQAYAKDSEGRIVYLVSKTCEMRIYYSENDYDVAYVDCYGSVDKVDLAVLKIQNPTDKRRPLLIKAVSDKMVGDTVYTVGYPGNADNDFSSASKYGVNDATVHKGTISRIVMNEGKGVERVSTDATIQHGNSGGPLVTEEGFVVGVNTNVESNSPYTNQVEVDYYSISSNELMTFLDKNSITYEKASSAGVSPVPFIIIGAVVAAAGVAVVVVMMMKKKKAAPAANGAAPAAKGAAPAANGAAAPAGTMAAVIRSMAVQHNGKTFPVGKAPVTIGRNTASCVIVFKEGTQGVSGVHCSVSFDSTTGTFTLTDLGSTYGTFLVSGQKLTPNTPVVLRTGDCFYVGDKANVLRVEVVK